MHNNRRTAQFLLLALSLVAVNHAGAAALRLAYAAIAPPLSGIWAAQETGAFKKYGLDVQLVYISSSTTNVQALLGGSIDIATPGSSAAVLAVAHGAPIVAIGSVMNRPPMTLYVQPAITRPEQLKGKVLGITRFGSTGHSVTVLMLRKMGLDQAITLRPGGGNPEMQAAFEQKAIAGFVTTVKPRAAANALLNAADLDIPYAMNLITVTRDSLTTNPDTAERVLKAYIEGVSSMVRDKDLAERILAKYLKRNDPGFLEETYSIVAKFMERVPRVDPRTVSTAVEFEAVRGADAKALSERLIDNSIVDKLVKEGFTEKVVGKARR